MNQRRPSLAQRDDVFVVYHRQNFAITPERRDAFFQTLFCQSPRGHFQVVANEQRLARFRQVVEFVGFVFFSRFRTFEMSNVHSYLSSLRNLSHVVKFWSALSPDTAG